MPRRTSLRPTTIVLAALVASATAGVARADARAYTAARAVLPAGLGWIMSFDLAAPGGRVMARSYWTATLAKTPGATTLLADVKDVCGAELPDLVDSLVMGAPATGGQVGVGVMVIAFTAHRDALERCVHDVAAKVGLPLDVARDGDTTRWSVGGTVILSRWLGDDVVAVPLLASDDATLASATAGGLARDRAMTPLLAKVDRASAVWAVIATPGTIAQLGETPAGAWGSVSVVDGALHADGSLQLRSAATAKRARALVEVGLRGVRTQLGDLGTFLDDVKLSIKGATLRLQITATPADFLTAAKALAGP